MESTTEQKMMSHEKTLLEEINRIAQRNIYQLTGTDPKAKYRNKTSEELVDIYFEENPVPRPKDIPTQTMNLFNELRVSDKLQSIIDDTEKLEDGEIKTSLRFLVRVISQAALERDSIQKELSHWRSKTDDLLCLYLKETWVKQIQKESGANYGRNT